MLIWNCILTLIKIYEISISNNLFQELKMVQPAVLCLSLALGLSCWNIIDAQKLDLSLNLICCLKFDENSQSNSNELVSACKGNQINVIILKERVVGNFVYAY